MLDRGVTELVELVASFLNLFSLQVTCFFFKGSLFTDLFFFLLVVSGGRVPD